MSEADLNGLVATLQANFYGTQDQRRDAYERFEAVKHDPNFCLMLSQIFAAEHLDVTVRQLAGIVLKNNMEASRARLGEKVFFEAGKLAMGCIDSLGNKTIAKTAASIVSRITSVTGLEWWKATFNVALDQFLVEGMLQSDNSDRSYLGILCLQFLVEDASPKLGEAVGLIVRALSNYAMSRAQQRELSDRALATLCNIYEFGQKLDWTVERYSRTQEGFIQSVPDGLRCAAGYFEEGKLLTMQGRGETRRLCLRILCLLIQFLLAPSDENHRDCARIANVAVDVFTSGIAQHERDVAIEAAEVLRQMIDMSQISYQEGGAAAGEDIVGDRLQAVLDTCFACMHLRHDDVAARLENDHPSRKDAHKTVGMSKRMKVADAMESSLDEHTADEGDDPLHDAAKMLLRRVSVPFAAPVFEITKTFAERHFNQPRDWRDQYLALDALVAIHDGCADHMSQFVCVLGGELVKMCEVHVQQAGNAQQRPEHHVMVIAMALHCLGKFFCDFVRLQSTQLAVRSFQLALQFMQHPTSKYVQFAAVDTVKNIVNACIVTTNTDIVKEQLRSVCETIAGALTAYHGNNFTLLCDFLHNFSGLLNDDELGFFVDLLARETSRRHERLVQTLGARYFQNVPNAVVEKEYFDIARAVSQIWTIRFVPERDMQPAMTVLRQMVDFMRNLLEAFTPIEDDAELLDMPLSILRNFTAALGEYKAEVCPVMQPLPDVLVRVYKRCPDLHIRSYALGNCHDMLLMEPALFSEETLGLLLRAIDDVFAGDNPNQETSMFQALQSDAALALYALAMMPSLPFPIDATMASVAATVRGDLADDNPNMSSIAHCAGIFIGMRPHVFKISEVEQVVCALRYAGKDLYGAQALEGVCAYLAGMAESGSNDSVQAVRSLLPDMANLLTAWSRHIHGYESSKQPVGRLLACTHGELERLVSHKALAQFRPAPGGGNN